MRKYSPEDLEEMCLFAEKLRQTILTKYNLPEIEPFISLKKDLINSTLAEDVLSITTKILEEYFKLYVEFKENQNYGRN